MVSPGSGKIREINVFNSMVKERKKPIDRENAALMRPMTTMLGVRVRVRELEYENAVQYKQTCKLVTTTEKQNGD